MDESKRGTGRTTRMLQEAKRLADEGRAVYVIAASKAQADTLEAMSGYDQRIKFEPCAPSNFDWEQMKLKGAHPQCVTLVDHYAIEWRFERILEMLYRFEEGAQGKRG
jgi:hypothetical protein